VNCWQWIDEVLALAGLPPVRKSMLFKTAWRLGAACEAVYRTLRLRGEPPMTRFLAAQLARSHWYDISAARRDLGYEPRVSTAEGMQRLAAWLGESGI
jgi:nucleoside-diphosphate-sugar epimerase